MGRMLLLGAAALTVVAAPVFAQEAPAQREAYRLRIANAAGGAVEVSSDAGRSWLPLGKTVKHASAVTHSTNVIGVVPEGTVAGVTPEQILLRVPGLKGQTRSLRILVAGQPATGATIATDVAAKASLFKLLAPPIGSEVRVERAGKVEPLPPGYVPRSGDRLLILVTPPPSGEPPTLTIENRPGGEVTLATPGGVPRLLARVKQPLKGVGRYAGTERAGCGAVVAWSPTTVVVSTAGTRRREGDKEATAEERGGFVIQPSEPALRGTTHPASQILIEAVGEGETKPPVSAFFGLPMALTSCDPLDPTPSRVEVKIDGGAWESCPDLRGAVDEAGMLKSLQAAAGGQRSVKEGITHLRIVYGMSSAASLQRRIRLATVPAAEDPQRGVVRITASVAGDGISFVQFFVDGRLMQVTNQPPYVWQWDTLNTANGPHLLEIRGLDDRLVIVSSVTTKVVVDN